MNACIDVRDRFDCGEFNKRMEIMMTTVFSSSYVLRVLRSFVPFIAACCVLGLTSSAAIAAQASTVAPSLTSEIIVDNLAAGIQDATRSFTGTWCTSSVAGYYGPSSLYNCSSTKETYRWSFSVLTTGSYDVYVRWSANAKRSTSVPYTVAADTGLKTVNFNQQNNGNTWVLHGRYPFTAGVTKYIEVSEANGVVCADAVRLVPAGTPTPTPTPTTTSRGFPDAGPWASFYGSASAIDLAKMAATFRIMDVDADPDMGNFTTTQIKQLQNGGANKVLSYLNLGSCENFRGYWSTVPTGFLSCSANKTAQLGTYSGYSNEVWMNVGNADYQNLVINYIVPRLVAQGVDGFYFDNMEIVEHGTNTTNGPCNAQCSQGGLDLIAKLRDKYPNMLFVMQNATGDTTRLGKATSASGTVAFPSLLDGIAHEEVYKPTFDWGAEAELVYWSGMNLTPGGRKFWISTLDYVGTCTNTTDARSAFQSSRARGFSPSVSDSSAGQQAVCYWPAF